MSRQTKSFLIDRFREMGISPASRHGQNFLIDLNLHDVIVGAAELSERDLVLEVGTGTGALTSLMAQQAGAVITVEIDRHLYELASEQLIDYESVTMLQVDALRNKNQLSPLVLDSIREHLALVPRSQLKLVANLPYNIATPVISNLLLCDFVPHSMVVTIQKELAERIAAHPWSKDYSALSVWIQSQADVEIVRVLPPTVFWPMPKVDSAILKIVVDSKRRAEIPELRYFHQFVKAIFLHRRKFLRANVVSAMKQHLTKGEVDEILKAMQLPEETRTEQLDVATLQRLTELVRAEAPDWQL